MRDGFLWVWDCNYTAPQTWTVRPGGRLSALSDTVCMMPANDGLTAGTRVGVGPCNAGDAAQIWRQGADNTIVNAASGLCLTAGALGYTSPFTLAACDGRSTQQWTMPT
jgi:hypothetical protein